MSYDPINAVEFQLVACAMKAKIGLLRPRDYADLAASALSIAVEDAELCRAIGDFWNVARRDQIAAGHAAHDFLIERGARAGAADHIEIAEQVQAFAWHRKDTYG